MPKLWSDTIDTHRRAVRDAILDTAWKLANAHGITALTMSQIAEAAGIGRATLYKYFPDVREILLAWHEQQVTSHLAELTRVCAEGGTRPLERLEAVLHSYATGSQMHHGSELAAALHQGSHVARAHERLHELIRKLIVEGSEKAEIRDDVPAAELAGYCLHALSAARERPTKAAVRRLVGVTLDGLRAVRRR